ncbi:unnamed protein product, partial [Leptidea sinapis]
NSDVRTPLPGVVETRPELAAQLAAAVDVALRHAVIDGGEGDGGGDGGGDDGGDGVPPPTAVAPVEPNEPLALPAHVCLLANEGVSAVVSGGGDGSAAAARSGLLLLTVEQQKRTGNDPALLHLYPHPDVLAEVPATHCKLDIGRLLQLFDPEWPLVRRVMAVWRREYERRLEGAADSVVLDQVPEQCHLI